MGVGDTPTKERFHWASTLHFNNDKYIQNELYVKNIAKGIVTHIYHL